MMKTKFLGLGLAALNLSLLAVVAAPGLTAPAYAQGTDEGLVERPTKGVGCPTGWQIASDSDYCEPKSSNPPKIYPKDKDEECADGYYDSQRYWCTTKR